MSWMFWCGKEPYLLKIVFLGDSVGKTGLGEVVILKEERKERKHR